MTQAQKIIKYGALAFAMFLVINIIGGILFAVVQLGGVFGLVTNDSSLELKYTENINNNIQSLRIDLSASILEIIEGNEFSVQYSSDNVKVNQNNNNLRIEDKGFSWFIGHNRSKVVVTLPENFMFEKADIDTGAGTVSIASLSTRDLDLDLGAGKVTIDELYVSNFANIDGGVGEVTIHNSSISKLDLDMGVGKTSIQTSLKNDSTIDAGVGEFNLNLVDSLDNYSIFVKKGIGTIKINHEEIANESVNGKGNCRITVSGGIGAINIKTNN